MNHRFPNEFHCLTAFLMAFALLASHHASAADKETPLPEVGDKFTVKEPFVCMSDWIHIEDYLDAAKAKDEDGVKQMRSDGYIMDSKPGDELIVLHVYESNKYGPRNGIPLVKCRLKRADQESSIQYLLRECFAPDKAEKQQSAQAAEAAK